MFSMPGGGWGVVDTGSVRTQIESNGRDLGGPGLDVVEGATWTRVVKRRRGPVEVEWSLEQLLEAATHAGTRTEVRVAAAVRIRLGDDSRASRTVRFGRTTDREKGLTAELVRRERRGYCRSFCIFHRVVGAARPFRDPVAVLRAPKLR